MPDDWNPHLKLEYMKVAIRSIIGNLVGQNRNLLRGEIEKKNIELNSLQATKILICSDTEGINEEYLGMLTNRIHKLVEDRDQLNDQSSRKMAFKARAKWYEYGEKSNKYFLNLNKKFCKQKIIERIKCEGKTFRGQEEVSKGITDFYKNLYKNNDTKTNENENDNCNFFSNCPKISLRNREWMEKEITNEELEEALKTCKDSAPGPDGISYSIYKKLWPVMGGIILESWRYSQQIGRMPESNLESIITILPKEGKDTSDIRNWRPITLTNCDAKIITKCIANKMIKVIEDVIDVNQTAYVKGRSVSDNLRGITFMKNRCEEEGIDAVLISLDAKKAFDSVSHEYIANILGHYGFGENLINTFKTLYNGITAKINVNGFMGNKINICRGVKQGDALSCALFILCIDPLIRNINLNTKIEPIDRETKISKLKYTQKCTGYADDISVICKNNSDSIRNVFREYEKLTELSGLELNAEKTEILALKSKELRKFKVHYLGKPIEITSVAELKICGIWFCKDKDKVYNLNITNKIEKLQANIMKLL
jgi:hypothetical protein